jgi:hypothetical protein
MQGRALTLLLRRVAPVAACLMAACAEHEAARVDEVADRPNAPPPMATTMQAQVQLTFYGGYEGFYQPDAARERSYLQTRTDQGGGFWSTQQDFSTAQAPMGVAGVMDVGTASFSSPGSMTLQLRDGGILVPPDTATARAEMRLAPDEASATGTWEPTSPIPVAPLRAAGSTSHAGTADRVIVTPQARDRAIAQLSRDYTELSAPTGLRRFEKSVGTERLVVDVSTTSGAVVREELWKEGSRRVETVRRYRTVNGTDVLSLQTTTIFDDQGRPAQRFEERQSDVRISRAEPRRTTP